MELAKSFYNPRLLLWHKADDGIDFGGEETTLSMEVSLARGLQ